VFSGRSHECLAHANELWCPDRISGRS
jgi:hypothetical protein